MPSSLSSPLSCQSPRVSIVGAGKVGSTLAQRILEKNLADVVLLGCIGWAASRACPRLMEVRGMEAHNRQNQPFWVNGEGQGELNRTASCPVFSTTKNPLDPP